jgi:hypothetical protein
MSRTHWQQVASATQLLRAGVNVQTFSTGGLGVMLIGELNAAYYSGK